VDTSWKLLLILLAIPGLLMAVLLWITIQDFRIRSWRQAAGRIVSSKPVARSVHGKKFETSGRQGSTDFITTETIDTRNFAEVRYEFSVAGKSFCGSRIDLAEDRGNFEVAETLQRYPQGKAVTVYYNPKNPDECILERDDPKNLRAGWYSFAMLVALCFGGVFGISRFAELVRGAIAVPKLTPMVVILGLFAFFLAVFAHMIGQKGRAMRGWPKTRGQVVQSAVEPTLRKHHRPYPRREYTETIYVSRVVYTYDVGGISFQGDNSGVAVGSSTPGLAAKYIARFPLNAVVDVFFNPQIPTESTLHPSVGILGIVVWTIAALFAAAALMVAGLTA
jgi:hypothetical protein